MIFFDKINSLIIRQLQSDAAVLVMKTQKSFLPHGHGIMDVKK
ncbi:MAG: hypothetical protein ACI8ZN_001639 [Bacteroidia bacterium]|jgi:hypothetical protein